MGGPLGSPAEPQRTQEEAPLDAWAFYVWRVKAAAAGITREQFSRMTLSEVKIHIEGQRWNHAMMALPVIRYHLSQLSDEDLDTLQDKKRPHPAREELLRSMLSEFAAEFQLAEKTRQRIQVIPGLHPVAAEGIFQAVEQKLLPRRAWLSIVKVWERVCKTAGRID